MAGTRDSDRPSGVRTSTRPAALRIVLVDDDRARATLLSSALLAAGDMVVAHIGTSADLLAIVRRVQPDAVVMGRDDPTQYSFADCAALGQLLPRPIVLFARSSNSRTIARAVRAGINAYVVDGLEPHRIKPIIDASIARFNEFQAMRRQIEQMRTRLADHRDIERAKAEIARRRGIDDRAAYAELRSAAMARRITVGQAARDVLAASSLLERARDRG